MKLGYRDIEPFIKKPNPTARAILVYGPDSGLMKERAKTIALTIVKDVHDPFNAITLSSEDLNTDPARLSDEASAISMMGGDRLIRITNASDKLTPLLKDYLKNPSQSALIILESAELSPRSTLRKLCETAKNAAAIPCYIEDERDLSRIIRETLNTNQLGIDNDALTWLSANISGDRGKVKNELEKLITYKGVDKTPVTLADVTASCGEAGALALDDLVYATANNTPIIALKTYKKLTDEDVSFVVITRTLQNHFMKLHAAKSKMESGALIESAMKSVTPPIFFKQQPTFKSQLNHWSLSKINKVLQRLADLEAQCKQTAQPVETLCAQAILSISKLR